MELMLDRRYSPETISNFTDQVLSSAKAFEEGPLPEELAFVYLVGFALRVSEEEGSSQDVW
jgi:transposase-like protein